MKKYIAELIGTMVLVLLGCGSAVIAGQYVGYYGISFAFGLAVVAMVYAIGSISGCHINPAISISMLVAGKISVKDTVFYVVFQCVGAIIGAGILYAIAIGTPCIVWLLTVWAQTLLAHIL
jgi:aquaporin Z